MVVCAAILGSSVGPSVAAASWPVGGAGQDELTPEQVAALRALTAAEKASLQGLSNKRIVSEFESLAAQVYNPMTRELLRVNEATSPERKSAVAKLMVRYSALRSKIEEIPGAKEKVYVKLFGDREHSPFYGAVSQDEFKDESLLIFYALTGSPVFLILYALANMGEREN